MRFLFRLLAFMALVAAVIVATTDAIRSVAAGKVLLMSASSAWTSANAGSLAAVEGFVRASLPPPALAAFGWLMDQPAAAVLLAVSLLCYLVGYRRPPVRRTVRR